MMEGDQTKTERKLRLAAVFLLAGLAVQLATLLVTHPLAFLAFTFIGSPLVLAGVVLYLWSVVTHTEREGFPSRD
jgi:uncharacterized membrane protein